MDHDAYILEQFRETLDDKIARSFPTCRGAKQLTRLFDSLIELDLTQEAEQVMKLFVTLHGAPKNT